MLLALGWYGYQSSRISPLIAGAGLLPLLARSHTRRSTIRLTACGIIGFVIVIAPLAYGFHLNPSVLFGRARTTSWLQDSAAGWSALASHLRATGWGSLGLEFDQSGGFFPFAVPVIPLGLIGLALIGLIACRSPALRWGLAAWILLVLIGNVLRARFPVYSPVLVCMVPALALAAGYSVRWFGWVAPLGVALVIVQPIHDYFHSATHVPNGEILPMAQAALLHDMDGVQTVFIAGGVGCSHGLTTFALHGRTCLEPAENALSPTSPAQLFILFPPFFSLNQSLSTRADLVEYDRRWGTTPVCIWSAIPLPQERS